MVFWALKTVRGKETIGNIWFDIDMRSLFYVERECITGKSYEKYEKCFAMVLPIFQFLVQNYLFSIEARNSLKQNSCQ